MKHKCKACNGSGTISEPGYREMEQTTQQVKPKKSLMSYMNNKFTRVGGLFAGVGAVVWIFIAVAPSINACNDKQTKQFNYDSYKNGIVLVEYDRDGNSIKCIIEREDTYQTSSATRTVHIYDRHDNALIARYAKMLNWDETKQGECFRFFYSFDEK